ncbi:serine O-acetyltransferase [Novispirillum itersonii]|uniref:Serine acetyltransferase n=1 Tax=Novispirillum itersonii TaxID=189 RepID=A0A7X0DMW9_NOVIT|nr:serine O-acetyltransferase [Novispirillum itersonii]MBB6211501.1 serine O-acetyltransferase [Novispirillum itersonii]
MTLPNLQAAAIIPELSWQTLTCEAARLSRKEPLLQPVLSALLPDDGSLAGAVAGILAGALCAPGMDVCGLSALFHEVLSREAVNTVLTRDLQAVRDRDPACTTYLHALLNYKGFQALQAHRIAHHLWTHERTELGAWVANRASMVLGPDIHPAARIGAGIMLDHGSGIVIGETAVVDDDVSILQNVTLGGTGKVTGDRHPKVRRGVMIGAGAKIIGNIEIGEFSKIAAGSVVLKPVPPRCTVAGIPAQVVRIHGTAEMPALSMNQTI